MAMTLRFRSFLTQKQRVCFSGMNNNEVRLVRIGARNYKRFQALTYWRASGQKPTTPLPEPDEQELQFASRPDFWVWAAEVEGEFAGWIGYVVIPKPDRRLGLVYVDELWTAPDYRRNGIAEVLMQKAFDTARELGLWKVRLYVGKDNAPARSFYKKMGFVEADEEAIFCQRNP